MNQVEIIAKQTEDAYHWVNKLVYNIPHNQWDTTPAIMETNISWQVQEHLLFMQQQSLKTIRSLTPGEPDRLLEPTPLAHPIASTKWEALDWNIKHTLWHCGQMGMLRRVVDTRFDFGLR